eukprot:332401-Chlamydomonas_euryale.AAC.2
MASDNCSAATPSVTGLEPSRIINYVKPAAERLAGMRAKRTSRHVWTRQHGPDRSMPTSTCRPTADAVHLLLQAYFPQAHTVEGINKLRQYSETIFRLRIVVARQRKDMRKSRGKCT